MTGGGPEAKTYASPPCMAAEVDPAYFDPLAVDPGQARDVARWRRAERERLRAERMTLRVEARAGIAAALAGHLDAFVDAHVGDVAGLAVSGYWPIKGEPDLRPWLTKLHDRGADTALPVVETPGTPLVFRRWRPGMSMVKGHWNIPVPPETSERITPAIALAPLVGWDGDGYRLGYGGGYFDRTLAALTPRPIVIGVGFQSARIPTIFPQPHDIRMSAIITEEGVQFAAPGQP